MALAASLYGPAGVVSGVRAALVVLVLALALALSGCMSASGEDWDRYDSGRGLAFGAILTILLITGAVLLITNLSASARPPPSSKPATEPAPEEAGDWQPVEPPATPAAPATRRPSPSKATKPAKPRRRSL